MKKDKDEVVAGLPLPQLIVASRRWSDWNEFGDTSGTPIVMRRLADAAELALAIPRLVKELKAYRKLLEDARVRGWVGPGPYGEAVASLNNARAGVADAEQILGGK